MVRIQRLNMYMKVKGGACPRQGARRTVAVPQSVLRYILLFKKTGWNNVGPQVVTSNTNKQYVRGGV